MKTENTCKVRVHDGRMSWDCGKPAVGTLRDFGDRNIPACKFHLTIEARREKRQAEYEAERRIQEHLLRQTQAKCRKLEALGVPAYPHFATFRKGGYTGKVVLDPDILLNRLRRE